MPYSPLAVPPPPGATPPTTPTPAPTAVRPPPQVVGGSAPSQPASYLAWDADAKETNAVAGTTNVYFTFWLTNVSTVDVLVHGVRTSCGCTVAQLPAQPWRLSPGSNGPINVTMNVQGKTGVVPKSVMVDTSTGMKHLLVKANVAAAPVAKAGPGAGFDMDRMRNLQLAVADRQAPLKGDCAKCHVEPAVGKLGKPLYSAACAICHNAEHRASMVPDLHALVQTNSLANTPEFWKHVITAGAVRPGAIMPAFAKANGGFLTDEQVSSLVEYLVKDFPKEPRLVYNEHDHTAAPAAAVPASAPAPAVPPRAQVIAPGANAAALGPVR